ncbi:MAG: tetratricopeptide repeat protein [Candidatus Saccharimonadales bacterium]
MPPSPPRLDEHGFPIPATFDNEPARRRPPRKFQIVWRSALVVACIAVLLGLVFQSSVADEAKQWAADWLIKRAQEKERLSDPQGALAEVNRAASLAPDNPRVLEIRAHLKQTLNDVEGSLEDYNAIIKLDRRYAPAYLGRSIALQRLNRHQEAIDDLTQVIKLSPSRDAMPRNNRAYARAMAGVELHEALGDVQQAITMVEENLARESLMPSKYAVMIVAFAKRDKAVCLDTRGYIYFLQNQYNEALADLELAIQLTDEFRRFWLSQVPAEHHPYYERQFDHELSVMYHHRGQVYEKLGKLEESRADLDLAKQLGYNPAEGVF